MEIFDSFIDVFIFQSLCGEDHIVKGVSVHISNAAPKTDHRGAHAQAGHMGMPRGGQAGRGDKGPSSYGPAGYGQGGGLGMAGGAGAGWTPAGMSTFSFHTSPPDNLTFFRCYRWTWLNRNA